MATPPTPPPNLLTALLDTVEKSIIPLTAIGVESGCKVFGAAILLKSDLSLVIAATNQETDSPLMILKIASSLRHMSLCLSGITWSGFDNHYHLFTYQDTRDAFAIPHDIRILEQVFKVPSTASSETPEEFAARPLYNKKNDFWESKSVAELVAEVKEDEEREALGKRVERIKSRYQELSEVYQKDKGGKGIPLA